MHRVGVRSTTDRLGGGKPIAARAEDRYGPAVTERAPALLCSDGSAAGEHAIAAAGPLLGGGPAIVLTVWEPVGRLPSGSVLEAYLGAIGKSANELDAIAQEHAREVAARGAELAQRAGFDAEALTAEAGAGVWRRIVEIAAERRVSVVVVGLRGVSGVRAALLGGVGSGVVHHCGAPVLVVPDRSRDRDAA